MHVVPVSGEVQGTTYDPAKFAQETQPGLGSFCIHPDF